MLYWEGINLKSNDGTRDVIVETIVRLIIPPIQLFGLYVVMHGHLSPGGGFQGGVIVASTFLLFALVFGLKNIEKRFKELHRTLLDSFGVAFYAIMGLVCIIFSGNYLDYQAIPFLSMEQMVKASIILILIALGLKVAAIVTSIFVYSGKEGV